MCVDYIDLNKACHKDPLSHALIKSWTLPLDATCFPSWIAILDVTKLCGGYFPKRDLKVMPLG
jgi:hypothetical protein